MSDPKKRKRSLANDVADVADEVVSTVLDPAVQEIASGAAEVVGSVVEAVVDVVTSVLD